MTTSTTASPDPTSPDPTGPASSSADAQGTAFEDLPPRRTIREAVAASALGNATEWYDYGAYAVVATYIATHFFPEGTEGLFWTYAFLAISFIARPFGGFIWGPLGDRMGRKHVLALTIILMSAATFLIGVLPTYEQVGILAPILLAVLRLVQGFSTGGEYGGAATFMAEYAPDKRRGLYGSFLEFGTLGGFALGTMVVLLLQLSIGEAAMADWGWRIPFFVAAPLGGIGLYLRSRLDETPVFQDLEDSDEAVESATGGLRALIVKYWKPILVMSGLVVPLNIANYTLLTYMPGYLETKIHLTSNESLMVILVGEIAMMAVIPFCGSLSDRIGRKKLWWFSMVGLFVMALPMYMLMGQGFGLAIVGFAVLGLLYIPQLSTISATFPAMFPAHVRFAGFAVTYNVITSIFGGTAAPLNEAVVESTGFLEFPAVYVMLGCVVGMVALLFLKETAGASLHGTGIPESEPEDYGIEAMRAEDEALDAAGR
ncbi:MFS transporter [Brachybacterium paraconglomeratum]|uniref:MFS transporter n=1 Tax=Brachybacterium paraconglomeratum TaxID=173362 RepID=UPI0031E9B124